MGLLGHVLGLAAGSTYEEALRTPVLEPLAMRNTAIALEGERAERIARGHDATGEVVPLWDLPALAGAGALRSDVGDMLRWLDAPLASGGDGLGEALRIAVEPRNPISAGEQAETDIGLGWMVSRTGDQRFVWHTGATGGSYTFVGFDPAQSEA